VRRFVLLALAGIALLLAGSLAVIVWMTGEGPAPSAPDAPAPVVEPMRPPPILAPPPAAAAQVVQEVENPAPKPVPEPPTPSPVDLSREESSLEAVVSGRCGRMQVRLGDAMRKAGDQITGQAILLFDVESLGGRVRLGQSRQQSAGNMRPSLVACAQMALRGQVVDAPGMKDGERFVLQVVVGMRP
jgi:hypothetical protein